MTFPLHSRCEWLAMAQCLGLLGVLAGMDFLTGHDVSFFLFYLVPIVFSFKRLGTGFAVLMCLLAVMAWRLANTVDGQVRVNHVSPEWAAALRLGIFLLVVSLLAVRRKLNVRVEQFKEASAREEKARRRLEQEVLEASEREQRRIGQDLHNSLCQQLTAAALAGKVLANQLSAHSRPEAEAANRLAGMMEKAIDMTRILSQSLRPIEMKDDGLCDGFQSLATNICNPGRVHCVFECPVTVTLATVDANMHLYRIAQEAINSAIHHGRAEHITIALKAVRAHAVLTVTDDGASLASEAWIKDGLGRQIMNYRASLIDARLEVELLPQGGTRVTCWAPIGLPSPAEDSAKEEAPPRRSASAFGAWVGQYHTAQ